MLFVVFAMGFVMEDGDLQKPPEGAPAALWGVYPEAWYARYNPGHENAAYYP